MIDFEQIDINDTSLREYQQNSKLAIYTEWKRHNAVMFQMPTGTGKTRLFVSIIKDIHNWSKQNKEIQRILVLAHREELIDQISENLGPRYGIAHGIIKSGRESEPRYPVQVASVQTLVRRLDEWKKKKFNFIIIDEAHHSVADTYRTIINCFPDSKILGVTATPYRLSGSGFRHIYGTLVISESIKSFIEKGYLSDYKYYSISPDSQTQHAIDNISDFDISGDYSEKAMLAICNTESVRANIVDSYLKYAPGKKGIIYTINRKHNSQVCKAFEDAGIIAEAIDSKTSAIERKRIVTRFKNGDIQILCNVNIFSEGFDCPDVEFIQLARPTKSLSMYLQQVGRGFRIHPDKDSVIILDNVGTYNRFGLPSAIRKWKHHFEGKGCIEDSREFIKRSKSIGLTKEIIEGDEEMQLIFSSVQDEKRLEVFEKNDPEIKKGRILPYPIDPLGLLKRWEAEDLFFSMPEEMKEELGIKTLDDAIHERLFWRIFYVHFRDHDEWVENVEDTINNNSFLIENYDKEKEYRNYIDRFSKVEVNNKWGIFDSYLNEYLIAPIYDELSTPDSDQNIFCMKDGKYGIINYCNSSIVVPFIYDSIIGIGSYTYIVEKDGLKGVIHEGNITIPIKYKYIHLDNPYFYRYLFISEEEYFAGSLTSCVFDRFFKPIFFDNTNTFPLYGNYNYGEYDTGHNEKHYFIINKHNGKPVIPFYYTCLLRSYNPDYPPIYCEHHGSYCFLDQNLRIQGEWIEGQFKTSLLKRTASKNEKVSQKTYTPGINKEDDKFIFCDADGAKVYYTEFDSITKVDENLYLTSLNGKYGIFAFDKKKRYTVKPELDEIKIQDGIYVLYKDTKIGLADKRNCIKPEYDLLEKIGDTLYKISRNGKVGVLKISDKIINWNLSPEYDHIECFSDDTLLIYKDGKIGLKTGSHYFDTIYDKIIILNNGYKIFEKDGIQRVGVSKKFVELPIIIDSVEHLDRDFYIVNKSGFKGIAKISSKFILVKSPIYDDAEFIRESMTVLLKKDGKRPRVIKLE